MTYTSNFVGNNMYEIETFFGGVPITFNVVVAKDEAEIDDLVKFHLNGLANPTPALETPSSAPTILDLQTQLTALQSQIAALISATTA
jgi:hypothetical protein